MIDSIISYHLSLSHNPIGGVPTTRPQVTMFEVIPRGPYLIEIENESRCHNHTSLVRPTNVA